MAIRVFHCDDSEAFTRLVSFWLAEHPDIQHVGQAHTVNAALDTLTDVDPDVVLLDTMGKPNSTDLLNAVRELVPAARIVVYSGYAQPLLEADAHLQKGDDDGALVATIRAVLG